MTEESGSARLKTPSERNLQIRQANAVTVGRARALRRANIASEVILWERLRGRRLAGLKFRRQCPLGSFIVDFFCADHGHIVELDGDYHQREDQRAYDEQRTACLQVDGYRVLRFSNAEVRENVNAVCKAILHAAQLSAETEPLARAGEGQG